MKELIEIQSELKAPKNQHNKFGGYNYRSCEDILEAVKPLLKKHGCSLILYDEVEAVGERHGEYRQPAEKIEAGDTFQR